VLVPDSPPGGGGRVRSWSALHRPVEPVVVVSTGGGTVRIWQVTDAQAPLSLPVWTLKAQLAQDASAGALSGPCSLRQSRGRVHGPGANGLDELWAWAWAWSLVQIN